MGKMLQNEFESQIFQCGHPGRKPAIPTVRSATFKNGYSYNELKSNEIRVFDILRKANEAKNDEIRIKIRKISLDEPGACCALSYVWGSTHADRSHLSHTVLDSNATIKVTKNLYDAMLCIRNIWDEWYDGTGDETAA